jgi:hypothetical protein
MSRQTKARSLSSSRQNSPVVSSRPDDSPVLLADEIPLWKLSPVELRVGAAAVGLCLLARWQALLPGYSSDDFSVLQAQSFSLPQAISQGRPLAFVCQAALAGLGVPVPQASVLCSVLLMIALAATGIAVCRLWGIRDRYAECTVAVLFIMLHPYQAEVFTFRITPVFLAIPLALSFAALLTCTLSVRHWWLALAAIVCSLSIYQVVMNYIAMALLFRVVFHLAGAGDRSPRFWRTLRSQLMLVCASIAVFVVLSTATSRIAGIAISTRGALIGFHEVGTRILLVATELRGMFVSSDPVIPLAPKLLMLALLAVMALYVIGLERKAAPGRARAFALAVAGGVPLCIGVVAVLQSWWPVPRVLAQTGMFWGGMFALVCHFAPPAGRRILFAGLSVILFSFIGLNGVIFSDQLRMNMRDIERANRVVARIEALPGFDQIRGVVIGGGSGANLSPVRTTHGDMNISAFSVAWSKVPILNEVSGYRFQEAPGDVTQKANAYCQGSAKWPAPESVIRMGSFAVVCLPE